MRFYTTRKSGDFCSTTERNKIVIIGVVARRYYGLDPSQRGLKTERTGERKVNPNETQEFLPANSIRNEDRIAKRQQFLNQFLLSKPKLERMVFYQNQVAVV